MIKVQKVIRKGRVEPSNVALQTRFNITKQQTMEYANATVKSYVFHHVLTRGFHGIVLMITY